MYSVSSKTEPRQRSTLVKNDFLPTFENEYFTDEEILGLCRAGVPYEVLSDEARKVADRMVRVHVERCKDKKAWKERYERLMAGPPGPHFTP